MTDTGWLADPVRAEQQEFHRFGGTGPIVHIAHANGFPPGTYRLLAETLTNRYRVLAMPARPLWPSSQPESAPTWHPLASDLVHGLDTLGATNVVGIGHSLGGVLTLWAASQRPDLFEAAILIEPVILPPVWLWFLHLLRVFGLQKRLPLVQRAKSRRRTWPSRQACYEHYQRTPFFAQWPDEALQDYVTSGTRRSDSDTIELLYPPAWEAHIFASTPTDIWRDVPHLRVPTLVIRGEFSEIFRPEALARMKRTLPQAQFVTVAGAGHLLPMEKAGETGAVIKRYLETVNTSKKAD